MSNKLEWIADGGLVGKWDLENGFLDEICINSSRLYFREICREAEYLAKILNEFNIDSFEQLYDMLDQELPGDDN